MTPTNNPAVLLESVIRRYFIWIIALSYVVAAMSPGFGLWIRSLNWQYQTKLTFSLIPIMLGLLLFNAGLGVKTTELRHLLRKPLVLLGGVFGNVTVPLAFILAISFTIASWHSSDEVQQILTGLAFVASMPVAGASTAWAQNADGDMAVSLGLVLLTTMLSPILTPLVLHAVGFVTTGDYSEDLHELASNGVVSFLGNWVILPSLLGILTGSLLGHHRIVTIMPYVKLMNFCILVSLNYSNASLTLPNVASHPDIDFLAVMLVIVIALCVTAFASGYLLARACRVDRKQMASLTFGLGMNNNGAGLVLASLALSDHPGVLLPIIFSNLTQHFVASLVDFSIFRRPPS